MMIIKVFESFDRCVVKLQESSINGNLSYSLSGRDSNKRQEVFIDARACDGTYFHVDVCTACIGKVFRMD